MYENLGGPRPSLPHVADAYGEGGQFFEILCGRPLCTAPYFFGQNFSLNLLSMCIFIVLK